MAKSYFAQPNIYRLQVIIEMISDGQILIPRFQRPFVWKDEKRLALLDSVTRGIPIGSLLVWRTLRHTLATYDHLGPYPVGGPRSGEVRTYLLDGHQRLSSLYGAFREPPPQGEQGRGEDEQDDSARWPIYVDLEIQDAKDNAFTLWTHGSPPPVTVLPVWKLLNPRQLYDHQKLLYAEGRQDCAERAEELAVQFKDYQIPIIPLVTEDLEQVKESFRRINSQGTDMNEVHMFSALMWKPDFDLNQRLGEIAEKLSDIGWASIDPQALLDIIKVGNDVDIYSGRSEGVIQESLERDRQSLDHLTEHVRVAATFLSERCGIKSPRVLPYKNQLVLLADAARLSGRDGFTESQADRLEQWFWATTYGEYFWAMTGQQLKRTAHHVRALLDGTAEEFPKGLRREIEPLRRFSFNSVRGRAFALLLARQLDQTLGEQRGQKADELLAEAGNDAVPRILLLHTVGSSNRGLRARIEGPENRWLVAPGHALELRRKIRTAATPQRELPLSDGSTTAIDALLQGHVIPAEAADALAHGQDDIFLRLRRQRLMELERQFVEQYGMKYIVKDKE